MKMLLMVIVLLLLSAPVLGDERPPFIYYTAEDGYVIARADGTESRILGAGLTREVWQNEARWSPSGEWLAWRGEGVGGCGGVPKPVASLYLAGVDGEHRYEFQAFVYDWNPTEDRLVLVGLDDAGLSWQVRDPIEKAASGALTGFDETTLWEFPSTAWAGETAIIYYKTQVALIHPDYTVTRITLPSDVSGISPQGEAIFLVGGELVALNLLSQAERRIKTTTTYLQNVEWSGNMGIAQTSGGLLYISRTEFRELDVPGEWAWEWVREGVAVAKSEEKWVVYDFIAGTQYDIPMNDDTEKVYVYARTHRGALSADENWIAYVEDGPVMRDLTANETYHVGPTTESYNGNWGGYIHWHPTENWLISEEEGVAGCGSSFYTQVTNGTQRYEIPTCSIDCAYWLPKQVNPALYPAYEKPAQPTPIKLLHAGNWVTDLVWSGDILQSQANNYASEPKAWNVTTEAEVPPLNLTPVDYSEDEWAEFGYVSGESEHYIVGRYVYDRQTKKPLFEEPKIYSELDLPHYLTPDEQFLLAGGNAEPLKIWSLPRGSILYEGMSVTATTLSPDGRYVAVGLGWDIAVYELTALLEYGRLWVEFEEG